MDESLGPVGDVARAVALDRVGERLAELWRGEPTLQDAARVVVDTVAGATGDSCSVLLLNEERPELEAVADAGPGDPLAAPVPGGRSGDGGTASAPVLLSGLCRGTVTLRPSSRLPDEGDRRFARALADRTALFLANASLHERRRRGIEVERDAAVGNLESARRVAEVLDAMPILLMTLDADGRIELVNSALMASPATSRRQLELLERFDQHYADALRALAQMTSNSTIASFADGLDDVRLGRIPRYEADLHAAPDGVEHWWHAIVVPHRTGGGVIITHDEITERRQAELAAAHRATHDALTGLPNRALLTDRLDHALARLERYRSTLAVIFIDLDHFKLANDTHGHGFGDELLVQVVTRLSAVVRPEDTLARFGGDEFVLLCDGLDSREQAEQVADRLLHALDEPVRVGGRTLRQSASLGVAIAAAGADASTLLAEADAALFLAKERGRARVAMFDEGSRRESVRRLDLMQALHRAIEEEELELHFQPIVSLPDGEVAGVESLLRWRRGNLVLGPHEFLDVADSLGLTLPLGRWVLGAACRQAAAWRAEGLRRRVYVNVSADHLGAGLERDLGLVLDRYALDGSAIGVEITETTLMHDPVASIRCLHLLRDMGVSTEVDDFGTGYSSLAYLKDLAPYGLKIDRTFVAGVHRDDRDRQIVGAVISLARGLGIRSTAEGIELPEQLATLIELGCDAAQGFLLRRPAPAHDPCPRTIDLRALAGQRG
ncbi:diguanylate cyclase (GGDEF)-like protein [Motilibacter rhizosphaerae]|uniref:Diguanylate cyclase (GGDEF)-like protein n=1 Tax=Motilibacter rhizosphaerae TaxID=598652 RepID=A0A4Q7NVA5_9ACTN|nr:EAL domain-containing protein [Motilibacter rhizosphaerae]RZS91173.1 diguanylate cyclase (GGDEF)-like protein [Motilibacter rhizosphaerae]